MGRVPVVHRQDSGGWADTLHGVKSCASSIVCQVRIMRCSWCGRPFWSRNTPCKLRAGCSASLELLYAYDCMLCESGAMRAAAQ